MSDERRREEWLLKDAAILYERHKPDRPEPFNVFTAMFNERDEVKLHSRFLAVLLGHPGEEGAANLRDFIGEFASESLRDFAPKGVKVERERHDIDILITNDHGQALAIENKIDAGDQPQQLERYRGELELQGYKDIHLLYLTIDGRKPSEDSRGDLNKKDYTPISYEAILPWLKRCRERAYDEPALRESVAQYLRLIEKLTDKDQEGSELMEELKKLLLRDNNLRVAHNLAEALPYAKASLMHKMWKKIKKILKEDSFMDLVEEWSDISECEIRNAIVEKRGFGLSYRFSQEFAFLSVMASPGYGFYVGVYCENTDATKKKYDEIRVRLESEFEGGKHDKYWPWWCVLKPEGTGFQSGDIKILENEDERKRVAELIANSAVEKLRVIRKEFSTENS